MCAWVAGRTGVARAVRGGSWINNARNVRSAQRNWNEPGNRNDNLGFRLARIHECPSTEAPEQTGVPTLPDGGRIPNGPPVCE